MGTMYNMYNVRKIVVIATLGLVAGCTTQMQPPIKPNLKVVETLTIKLPKEPENTGKAPRIEINSAEKTLLTSIEKSQNINEYILLVENISTEDLWLPQFSLWVKSSMNGYSYGDVVLTSNGVRLLDETQDHYSQGRFPSNPTIFDANSKTGEGYKGPLEFSGLKVIIPKSSKLKIAIAFPTPTNFKSEYLVEARLLSYKSIGSSSGLLSTYENSEIVK